MHNHRIEHSIDVLSEARTLKTRRGLHQNWIGTIHVLCIINIMYLMLKLVYKSCNSVEVLANDYNWNLTTNFVHNQRITFSGARTPLKSGRGLHHNRGDDSIGATTQPGRDGIGALEWHPILCPHRWTMGCFLSVIQRKMTAIYRECIALWCQISLSTSAQVMTSCLTVPNHYLNQCWIIISTVLWHSAGGNFTRNVLLMLHLDLKMKLDTAASHRGNGRVHTKPLKVLEFQRSAWKVLTF